MRRAGVVMQPRPTASGPRVETPPACDEGASQAASSEKAPRLSPSPPRSTPHRPDKRHPTRARFYVCTALAIACCRAAVPLPATGQEVTGELVGRVVASDQQPMEGVRIEVSGTGMPGVRVGVSDDEGAFRLLAVQAGSYSVRLTRIGFRSLLVADVSIRLGLTTNLGRLMMDVEAVEMEPLVVTATQALIDPSATTMGANLTAEAYDDLPADRAYASIVPFLPQANQSFSGDAVNVAGSTGLENAYFIEGVNVTDPFRATTGTDLPHNFVREIQFKVGGYEARYEKALGGVINVITHSGGDELKGQAYGFFSNSALTGDPRPGLLETSTGDFSSWDLGFDLGGPIVREKATFFAAYNPSFESKQVEIPGLGFHDDQLTAHRFAAKVDWRPGPDTDLALSVFGDPTVQSRVGDPSSFLTAGSAPAALENPDPFLGHTESGGTNISLTARTRFGSWALVDGVLARHGRRDDIVGDTQFGRDEPLFQDLATGTWSGGFGTFQEMNSTRYSAKLGSTLLLGSHTVRGGLEYEESVVDLDTRLTEPGLIQKVGPSTFAVLVATMDFDVRNRVPAAYVQDSWEVSERLTLNAGLRWSGQWFIGAADSVAQSIPDQYQPRLGFVFQPGLLGTQRIFGHFGRFYQGLPLFSTTLGGTTWDNRVLIFDQDPRLPEVEPVSEQVFADPEGPPASSKVEGLQGEHQDELLLGYERALWTHTKLGVQGIHRSLRAAVGSGFDPAVGFVSGNPGKGELDFLPEAKREYTALVLVLERAGAPRLNYMVSYVLSRNRGNYSGLFNSDAGFAGPGNHFSLQLAEQAENSTGLLPNDRPHVFKLFASYRFDFGLTAGTFFTAQSGTPLNELGATFLPFRPSFLVERGSAGRTPAIWDLNFRLSFDLGSAGTLPTPGRLILDVRHLGSPQKIVRLDQVRYLAVDESGDQGSPNPSYGEAIAYQPPISVRLGFEVGF